MENNSTLSHDTKTLITVLLLIFFYPAGVVLMFVWMNWPNWVKVLVLSPVLVSVLALVLGFSLLFV